MIRVSQSTVRSGLGCLVGFFVGVVDTDTSEPGVGGIFVDSGMQGSTICSTFAVGKFCEFRGRKGLGFSCRGSFRLLVSVDGYIRSMSPGIVRCEWREGKVLRDCHVGIDWMDQRALDNVFHEIILCVAN